MKKGEAFERDGRRYEVMQAGLQYKPKQKACIRSAGASRSITVGKAVAQGLVRDVGRSSCIERSKDDAQLPLGYPDKRSKSAASRASTVTESRTLYGQVAGSGTGADSVFYMPVAQLRAQVFLAHGLLYPAAYDDPTTSAIADVQTRVPDGLVLWQEQPPITSDEILFGLRLTREERADAEQQADVLYISTPLPISRLVEIAVPAKSSADVERYIKGWIEPDVPIPTPLFTCARQVVDESDTCRAELTPKKLPPTKANDGIREAAARYNRILGLFAFMRNAARYHTSRLGLYADYPAQFFHLARQLHQDLDISGVPEVPISPCLLALLEQNAASNTVENQLRKLVTTPGVYIDQKAAEPVAASILQAANADAHLEQAFALLFDEDYKAALPILQKEPIAEAAVLLAALYKFSDRQSNDHRNLKQTLHDDWSSLPLVATVLGMLGSYYGYTALDARETRLYSVDHTLADRIDPRPQIKFHLERRFERELIEAVYQYAFYNKKLSAQTAAVFDGLHQHSAPRPAAPLSGYWKDDTYQVADVWTRAYRLTPLGRCLQRIEALPSQTIDQTTTLGQYLMFACMFHADEYELSRKRGKETMRYSISKRRLLDLLANHEIRVSSRMLATSLDEDADPKK